jgi:endonuclease III-like uncharacterized protein
MKNQERIKRQEEMLSLIEQWQESGQPQQAFCKERNLSYTTFYYWLRSYRRRLDKLKEKFRLNGLPYTLLKRNEVVALYGIGGEYNDEILHWEVDKIYIRKDKYGIREALPTNEKFGRDLRRCFMNEEKALNYFDTLTTILNQGKGVAKVVTGVQENAEVIPEYSLVEICDPCN